MIPSTSKPNNETKNSVLQSGTTNSLESCSANTFTKIQDDKKSTTPIETIENQNCGQTKSKKPTYSVKTLETYNDALLKRSGNSRVKNSDIEKTLKLVKQVLKKSNQLRLDNTKLVKKSLRLDNTKLVEKSLEASHKDYKRKPKKSSTEIKESDVDVKLWVELQNDQKKRKKSKKHLRIGMISHKMSLITIFGHKHKIKNFI